MLRQELATPTAATNSMLPDLLRVRRVIYETYDTFTLEIEPHNNDYPFAPGQFNMLYMFGVGEIPLSISGNPTDPSVLLHTTRAVGTVTKAMKRLKRDDWVGIRGPFGQPWPVEQAIGRDVVIIAGGIGLAPLRPVLYTILSQRDKYGKVVLLYGCRSPKDVLYRHEIERWRGRFDLEVHVTVDYADTRWHGNIGTVTTLIPKAPFDPQRCIAYICGPEVMMRFAAQELRKRGVEASDIVVSMERNMKCGIGVCGHCQFGPFFVCRDGPVFYYNQIQDWLAKAEI